MIGVEYKVTVDELIKSASRTQNDMGIEGYSITKIHP